MWSILENVPCTLEKKVYSSAWDRISCKYLLPNIGAPQYIRQTLTDVKGEIDVTQ